MSCSRIYNDYDGVTHDYTRKQGLVWEQIFLPENAPKEWADRSVLWNAVETSEKSKDSRLARELIVALPKELSQETNEFLLQYFIEKECVAKGMCAHVCYHDTDGHNPHAHIMLTVRPLNKDGTWQHKTEKEYLCVRNGEERGFTAAEFLQAGRDNHGIDLAKGEYIGIIESDDWIEPTMYEKLYRNAEENGSDLVKAQFYIYNSAKSPADKLFDNRMRTLHDAPDGVFSIEKWPKLFIYHASIWSNLYRSEFLKKIKLVETRSASYQDFPFMCECYCRAQFISVVKEPLVHYRMEEGQQSSTIRRDERLLLMADQCMNGREILKRYGKFEALKDEFHFHAYAACAGFYRNVYWKHKLAYMRRIRTMMSESGDISLNPYLTSSDRRVVRHIKSGHLIRSLFTFKEVRRMLFAMKITHSGFAITFLGIRLICGECKDRPSLVTIRI